MSALSTHVGRHRKFGEFSCSGCTGQGIDFELISAVDMETRNLVEGFLVVNFWRSAIIAELWRPELARQ